MNFDAVQNRRGTNSLKWNVPEDELPLWVADMDFATAPAIIEAIHKRLENQALGYSIITKEWNQAYVNWWKNRYNHQIDPESLIFCTGVVPAISSIIRKLTSPSESIVILTPVYNVFINTIANNGRTILQCPLKYDKTSDAKDAGTYNIDWRQLEGNLADPKTSLLIFCNPHNPVGKIWSTEELKRVGDLCKKHNVTVISDEIHCDITIPGKHYIPFASVSETCRDISIVCIAPTKTFNIAGLQTAAVAVANPDLRNKVQSGINTDEIAEPNIFAIQAAIAAYNHGEAWLEELLKYIQENRRIVADFLKKEISEIKLVEAEATYLLWLDCKEVCKKKNMDSFALEQDLRKNAKVFISKGSIYGDAGEGFLRMNIACPRSILQEALNRLKNYSWIV